MIKNIFSACAKPLFALLAVLGFSGTASAQLLWRISGNGLNAPSYLYGTVHVGDERAYTFVEAMRPYMDSAQAIAGELDLSQLDLGASMGMMMGMFMPSDTTLEMLLSKKEYALVKRKMDKRFAEMGMAGMGMFMERMKPIFIGIMLADMPQAQASGKPALDLYLQQQFKEAQKEVLGLETFAEQMGIFDKIPLATQAKMLYDQLSTKDKENEENPLDKMLDMYAQGDLEGLYAMSSAYTNDPEVERTILTARNTIMANRMEPHIKARSMFVAVGAAHLPGKLGIVALLREKGYLVEPVPLTPKND